MAHYLWQVAYSTEGWAALVKNPQNRIEAVRPAVENLGGKIESGWFSFGKYDVVAIVQFPDNVTAAAMAMAVGTSATIRAFRTTPLLSPAEGVEAMKKASSAGYKPAAH